MWKLPLSDLLFAEPCLICRKPIGEADPFPGLCRHCLSQLPWRASDSRLAWPPEVLDNLRSPKTGFLPAATEDAFQESRIIIACDYESPIREGLLALKFSDATEWHRLFGRDRCTAPPAPAGRTGLQPSGLDRGCRGAPAQSAGLVRIALPQSADRTPERTDRPGSPFR
jgi:hypothetical protein